MIIIIIIIIILFYFLGGRGGGERLRERGGREGLRDCVYYDQIATPPFELHSIGLMYRIAVAVVYSK